MTITDKEYVDSAGLKCPICKKTETVRIVGPIEVAGGVGWQDCICKACDAKWTDDYRLIGYNGPEHNVE